MQAGITCIVLVILYILFFILLPHIITLVKHCNLNSSGNSASCNIIILAFLSVPIGIFVATPLIIIGSLFILYSILSWRKVKSPGLTAFLSVFLVVIMFIFLAVVALSQLQ